MPILEWLCIEVTLAVVLMVLMVSMVPVLSW